MSSQEARAIAVAGEDAAIYAYGVISAVLSNTDHRRALAALRAHQSWRDRLAAVLPAGATPTAAIAYDFPYPVTDSQQAVHLAQLVENRLVVVYADLAAAATGDERADAVLAASECATRAVVWGAPSQAFPHGA